MNGDGWTTSQARFAEPAAGVGAILDRAVATDHRKQSRQRCRSHGWVDIRLCGDGSCLSGKCPQMRAPTLFLYCATLPARCTRFAPLWNRGCALRRKWMELDWRHRSGRRHSGLLRSGTASWQICRPAHLKPGLIPHSVNFREQGTCRIGSWVPHFPPDTGLPRPHHLDHG